jgi:hypothetical protein
VSATEAKDQRRFNPDRDARPWKGGSRPYDIAKELTICFVVVLLLVLLLSALFSSPDDHAITLQQWSGSDQVDFAQTAITELNGTSGSAQYGPPYNHVSGVSQKIGPISLESLAGVRIPVNPSQDFVLGPLSTVTGVPSLQRALAAFNAASPEQQTSWEDAYSKAVAKASVLRGALLVPEGRYGPVGTMIDQLTRMARSGALDASMINQDGFYGTNYTKSLLFVADGQYFASQGDAKHLSGDQWGMMNETGNFPGQAWLWLYTFWYQIPPFTTSWSANADVLVWALMMVLTVILILVPFIPGLRSIPRWSRVYRVIWRDYYKGRVE